MFEFIKGIGKRLENRMVAPEAQEADGYYDYYDDYDDYDDYEDYSEPAEQFQVHSNSRKEKSSRKDSSRSSRTTVKDNVYGFTPSPGTINVHKQSETIIQHPKSMEDAVEIGNHVRGGRLCIVDLTGVPTSEAQRIADYLCGVTDAVDGAITRVNSTIIAVSPSTHRVMQDYRERENGSFDTGFFKKTSSK